jgi:hypothetical protein
MSEEQIKQFYEECSAAGKASKDAVRRFERTINNLRGELPIMPDDMFWSIVEVIRTHMDSRTKTSDGFKMETVLDRAFWEIRHGSKATFNTLPYGDIVPVELEEDKERRAALVPLIFSKKWNLMSSLISTKVETSEGEYYRGDDAWGDFQDSIPLLGESLSNAIMSGNYSNEKELREDFETMCIAESCAKNGYNNLKQTRIDAKHMVQVVFTGENYIQSTMRKTATELFAAFIPSDD